jgi:hypothetical protein
MILRGRTHDGYGQGRPLHRQRARLSGGNERRRQQQRWFSPLPCSYHSSTHDGAALSTSYDARNGRSKWIRAPVTSLMSGLAWMLRRLANGPRAAPAVGSGRPGHG